MKPPVDVHRTTGKNDIGHYMNAFGTRGEEEAQFCALTNTQSVTHPNQLGFSTILVWTPAMSVHVLSYLSLSQQQLYRVVLCIINLKSS